MSTDNTNIIASAGHPVSTSCTCAMIRRTARRVTQAYDKALSPIGLKTSQYMVLANISQEGGLTITELAERLAIDRTTLTRNLRPMVKAGWLRIDRARDKRGRAVYLNTSGMELVARAKPLWWEAESHFRASMGKDQIQEFRLLLDAALVTST